MKVHKLLQAGVAALVFGTGMAQAAPVVNWTVSDFAFFNAPTVTPGGNALPNPTLGNCVPSLAFGPVVDGAFGPSNGGNLCTGLRWGTAPEDVDANNISFLQLQSFGPVNVVTNGAFVPTLKATHGNFPIITETPSPFLQSVQVIALISINDGATTATAGPLPIQVNFIETPNLASGGSCLGGGTAGSNGCPDIFVLTFPIPNFSFAYLGFNYQVDFQDLGATALTAAQCGAAGAAAGCRGFVTQENLANDVFFNLKISTVPEPGSMALVGGALAALGFIGRRRKQKQQA